MILILQRHRCKIPELLLGTILTVAIFTLGMLFHAQVASSVTKDSDVPGWAWLTRDASGFSPCEPYALRSYKQSCLFFSYAKWPRVDQRGAFLIMRT